MPRLIYHELPVRWRFPVLVPVRLAVPGIVAAQTLVVAEDTHFELVILDDQIQIKHHLFMGTHFLETQFFLIEQWLI